MPWGNRSIVLRDPDGNLVNLFQPVTDDPTTKGMAMTAQRRNMTDEAPRAARLDLGGGADVHQVSGISHHFVRTNGAELHFVSAGTDGSPILLVHGFPETWWAFHKVIPILAEHHRVFAVDLRGFGDSSTAGVDHDSTTAAEDLHQLISHLGVGPVHLTGQDISGSTVFRLATIHPEDVRSFTAIEMGLAGYGLESLADVAHGGSWHIGVLAAPGVPEMLFVGRERDLLGNWAFPSMTAVTGSIASEDVAEFARTYARPDGWRGAEALYRSMLSEGGEIKALAGSHPLTMPVLAVGAAGGDFTLQTISQVASGQVASVQLDGVGHYAAMEAPEALAAALLDFLDTVDATR